MCDCLYEGKFIQLYRPGSIVHIIPTSDWIVHADQADDKGKCACLPRMEIYADGSTLMIHNALDGREAYQGIV